MLSKQTEKIASRSMHSKRLCVDILFLIRLLMYAMETLRASSSGGGQMLLRDEEPADAHGGFALVRPSGGVL